MTAAIVITAIFGYLSVGWWLAPVMAGKTCARAIEEARQEWLELSDWWRRQTDQEAYAYGHSSIDREWNGSAVYALTIPFWPLVAAYYALSGLRFGHNLGYRARMMAHDPALRAETIKHQQQRIAQLERELGIGAES